MYGVDLDWLVGKVLDEVVLDSAKDLITFKTKNGDKRYSVEGDCCSRSWIEHLEMPKRIKGARVLEVVQRDMEPWDGHKCEGTRWDKPCGHDSLSVYHTVFRTDKGDIVLEYRNDSNGYYGGYLVDA